MTAHPETVPSPCLLHFLNFPESLFTTHQLSLTFLSSLRLEEVLLLDGTAGTGTPSATEGQDLLLSKRKAGLNGLVSPVARGKVCLCTLSWCADIAWARDTGSQSEERAPQSWEALLEHR